MKYRIVNTDNFGGDYPNESFVGGEFDTAYAAGREAEHLNGPRNDYAPRYHKVVEEGYILQPGFTP